MSYYWMIKRDTDPFKVYLAAALEFRPGNGLTREQYMALGL
jgi:hypothetical protein